MSSSACDPIKFDWFYLEQLRRSARLASREERLAHESTKRTIKGPIDFTFTTD